MESPSQSCHGVVDTAHLLASRHAHETSQQRDDSSRVTLGWVEFGILGALHVVRPEGPVEIRRGIPRALLVALIVQSPEAISTGRLAEMLWGDAQPLNPTNALQVQISYLRRALGVDDGLPSVIVTRSGGYALDVAAEQIDARRFEDHVRAADDAGSFEPSDVDLDKVLKLLDEALGMWRGEPLIDAADSPFAL